MHSTVKPGRVVILNGTSSAGKTGLARAFRDRRAVAGECWLIVAIDDFNVLLPHQWFAAGDHVGPFSGEGVRFVPGPDGMGVALGEVGRRLFEAYRRTAGVWARQGLNVVVDEVCFDDKAAQDWDEALAGLPVIWVAVHCDPREAEARERARDDRLPGLAHGMRHAVQRRARYDLELDATTSSPAELAATLEAALCPPRSDPVARCGFGGYCRGTSATLRRYRFSEDR